MEIIIHSVNTIKKLKSIDDIYGTEIDIRSMGSQLILNHEPFLEGDKLEDYLDEYSHGTLILNIKEHGIEKEVLNQVKQRPHIKNFFMLDVQFPFIMKSLDNNEKKIALRFSKYEDIKTIKHFIGRIDWVWIDTYKLLSFNNEIINILQNFKTCIVCPERWNMINSIGYYREVIKNLDFNYDAVMTNLKCVKYWKN